MTRALLALLLTTGCGMGYDPTAPMLTRCDLGPVLETEWQADCTALRAELELAQSILLAHGLTTRAEMVQAFSGLPIRAYDTHALACELDVAGVCVRKLWGIHHAVWPMQWIELERTGRALAHELIHQLQATRGQIPGHAGWDTNGYGAADAEFKARHRSWRTEGTES
jgi:hypothetical protein